MAKTSGLGWTTFDVDDSTGTPQHLKNDANSLDFSTPRAVQDTTGLDKLANERLPLLCDFSATATGVFNTGTGASHAVFKDSTSTTVMRTLTMVIASQTLACETWITDYPLTRDAGGAFTWKVPFVLADGTVPTWS
jgi:hypothetical protein